MDEMQMDEMQKRPAGRKSAYDQTDAGRIPFAPSRRSR
jgi:hypothetical protein